MVEEAWLEDDRSQVFMNASILALRDGQLSNGEKRILVKLAHALKLQEDEPKRIYDAILSGETESISGDRLGHSEKILVYGQVLEAMLIHTDRSEEVLAQIAYLRKMFAIEEARSRWLSILPTRQRKMVRKPWWSQFYQMPVIHIFRSSIMTTGLERTVGNQTNGTDHTFSKAFSKSAIRSSGSSIPTESLTRPSSNPLAKRSSRGTSA